MQIDAHRQQEKLLLKRTQNRRQLRYICIICCLLAALWAGYSFYTATLIHTLPLFLLTILAALLVAGIPVGWPFCVTYLLRRGWRPERLLFYPAVLILCVFAGPVLLLRALWKNLQ